MIVRVTNESAYDYMPADVASEVLRRARSHLGELLSCELPRTRDPAVPIVCVAEVDEWLAVLASRVEHGERLRRAPAPPTMSP